jgi:hypothetical protein
VDSEISAQMISLECEWKFAVEQSEEGAEAHFSREYDVGPEGFELRDGIKREMDEQGLGKAFGMPPAAAKSDGLLEHNVQALPINVPGAVGFHGGGDEDSKVGIAGGETGEDGLPIRWQQVVQDGDAGGLLRLILFPLRGMQDG